VLQQEFSLEAIQLCFVPAFSRCVHQRQGFGAVNTTLAQQWRSLPKPAQEALSAYQARGESHV
jgi:hypothetical protein